MDEYIEREALLNRLKTKVKRITPIEESRDMFYHDSGVNGALTAAMLEVENAPAADVVPVVHGRLVLRSVSDVTSTFMCSECGREFEVANAYFGTPTNHPNKNYPYCNCGARMDGADE